MPVLGAVAHLSTDPTERLRCLAALGAIPGLSFGEEQDTRLPIVVESDSRQQDRERWKQVEAAPGLTHLELAFVDFSDLVCTHEDAVEPS